MLKAVDDVRKETPPRMWGRRGDRAIGANETGNTPTHVGKTTPKIYRLQVSWKHPHACGEDKLMSGINRHTIETPPRMWGRLARRLQGGDELGNTPTHVGKTPAYCV